MIYFLNLPANLTESPIGTMFTFNAYTNINYVPKFTNPETIEATLCRWLSDALADIFPGIFEFVCVTVDDITEGYASPDDDRQALVTFEIRFSGGNLPTWQQVIGSVRQAYALNFERALWATTTPQGQWLWLA